MLFGLFVCALRFVMGLFCLYSLFIRFVYMLVVCAGLGVLVLSSFFGLVLVVCGLAHLLPTGFVGVEKQIDNFW
jgi:hypothetical protein